MYDETKFPYILSRNKYKIDLIDLEEKTVHTLQEDVNATLMSQKMVLSSTKSLAGHSIDIYYNCQIADKRAVKCLSIDP